MLYRPSMGSATCPPPNTLVSSDRAESTTTAPYAAPPAPIARAATARPASTPRARGAVRTSRTSRSVSMVRITQRIA
jgi:hypothetical protein